MAIESRKGTLDGPRWNLKRLVLFRRIHEEEKYRDRFLYLNNTNVMGNAAPKDQVLTMKWMQDNIVAFGGDPKRVTLFNVSAGVSTVPLHLVPIDRKSKWITVISSVLHASP
ncbi:cholinesterase 1-like isoform X2 [Ptiloglossa arizonensis]|uniref:cholinesterase 1-like isoform X2 n=1 Tax=Ptiloglossa arizonensis TaxID=3350558 RepID=UPI003F9F9635